MPPPWGLCPASPALPTHPNKEIFNCSELRLPRPLPLGSRSWGSWASGEGLRCARPLGSGLWWVTANQPLPHCAFELGARGRSRHMGSATGLRRRRAHSPGWPWGTPQGAAWVCSVAQDAHQRCSACRDCVFWAFLNF